MSFWKKLFRTEGSPNCVATRKLINVLIVGGPK